MCGVTDPHFEQQNSNRLPHSMQNLAGAGFLNWHFGHFTAYSPKNKARSLEDITQTCDDLQDH
jgi:hypothetical protein